jgi:hypothetical protein
MLSLTADIVARFEACADSSVGGDALDLAPGSATRRHDRIFTRNGP